jgi:hypothetical protein
LAKSLIVALALQTAEMTRTEKTENARSLKARYAYKRSFI